MTFALLALAVAAGTWIHMPGGAWRPDAGSMAMVKSRLEYDVWREAEARRLELPDWSTYSFQYQGRQLRGRQVIFVNGFCRTPATAETQFVIVFEGGPCYFNAVYDLKDQRLASIHFNSEF